MNKEQVAKIESLIKQDDYQGALGILGESPLNNFREKYLKVLALEGARKYEDAVTILNELSTEKPENINLIMKKGRMEEFLGRIDDAVESYDKVLFFDPFNHFAKERLNKIKSSEQGGQETGPVKAPKEEKGMEEKEEEAGESPKPEIEFDRVDIKDHAIGDFKISGSKPAERMAEDAREASQSTDKPEEKAGYGKTGRNNGPSAKEPEKLEEVDGMIHDDIDAFFHQGDGKKAVTESPPGDSPDERTAESNSRDPEYGFITRSAAELYEKQGLLDEAMVLYEKLSKQSDDPGEYAKDIQRVRKNKAGLRLIERLKDLKRVLKKGVPSV